MSKRKNLSKAEIASFCRQTALIIQAGITPAEGMSILIHDTINDDGKALLKEIEENCHKGYMFHESLDETHVFPEYVIRLVALGEESGNLDTVLVSLAEYYEREDDIADSIKSAVTYPLIMIGMMFLIIIVLVVKVLPIFKQVFVQLGTDMSPLATKLMNIGSYLSDWAIVITIILAVIIAVFFLLYRIPPIKRRIQSILAHLPGTRDFYANVAAGRFASGMYLAFSSGMDMFHALDMIEQLIENDTMAAKITKVREEIKEHASMPEALEKAQVFSNLYSRMVAVAFRSGSVDTVMEQIAVNYENATDKQLRRIVSIIEPTLVIILSLIVGVILLSVLLPLMGIMSSIG
ncbi:MAG: type II secretion system F family protein [Lachnospiraceae bacterium]|nr:type II secretion system F family protein [Lachnospiraceae bacterium]